MGVLQQDTPVNARVHQRQFQAMLCRPRCYRARQMDASDGRWNRLCLTIYRILPLAAIIGNDAAGSVSAAQQLSFNSSAYHLLKALLPKLGDPLHT